MNYSDLVKKIAESTGTERSTVDTVLKSLSNTVTDTLKNNDSVAIPGFVTFKPKDTPARVGRNPSTGAAIQIAAKKSVTVSLSKNLKDELNK